MIRQAVRIAAAALVLLLGIAGPVLAQRPGRVTDAFLEELRNKVELHRNAYSRFEMAERDAMGEGSEDAAAVYRQAKTKELEQYYALNAQLENARKAKKEQDLRASEPNPDYR